ncbi:BON domain-containing protein [Burkholderia gladioli]|uniref:BON domain-containing protein n=1 Tax=Burkholderia gladioli TaxID=28095 RepID=UPI001640EF40|nr:BON domain-containing protein [Burkholderia gladioli]
MQGRHPNRSRHAREPANWQERNERAYWGSDERDLPHYDDLLLPDDERDIDFHDARDQLPGDRFDERRWRAGPREAAGRDRDIPRPRERDGSDEAYREAYREVGRQPVRPDPRAGAGDEPGRRGEPSRLHGESRRPGADARGPGNAGRGHDYRDRPGGDRLDESGGGHGAPSHARYDPRFAPPAGGGQRAAPRIRGPKGYTRSDERIREDVCERLAYAFDLDVSEVSVAVREACVRLEGSVPERWMKHEIEDLAASCVWVRDVDNLVRVPRDASRDELPRPLPRADALSHPAAHPGSPDPAAHPSGAIGPAGPAGPGATTGSGPDGRRH